MPQVPPRATVRSTGLIQIPAQQSSMFIYSTVHGITSSETQLFVRQEKSYKQHLGGILENMDHQWSAFPHTKQEKIEGCLQSI